MNENSTFADSTKQFEENVQRAKDFNARVLESSKATGRLAVDNYEKAVKSTLDFQRQLAGASQVEWATSVANTQIQLAQDVTDAWTKAARELLK
ncbi:hypothetical protein CGZ93_07555 [Enemella dayhoffiae]|uniref:Phasin family protein n=1 Tax=Enemella dayhoffiae TaxID=2016507 RepID=A0A255H5V8_9ACTN|nr:hypothetical protein [Enemella dayhoffiae]OYO22696.1 hypothetical protein CGZ93_07555 [Enemella dayhoffiae]